MKKILGLLSILICMVMVLAILPMSVSADDSEWDFKTLQSYDTKEVPGILNGAWYDCDRMIKDFSGYEWESSVTAEGSVRSLKLTTAATESLTGHSMFFMNLYNADYISTAGGMRVWIANPSENIVKIKWTYMDNVSLYSNMGSGKTYYLQSENSATAYTATTTADANDSYNGLLSIPAGFKGFVYAPFSSTDNSSRYAQFRRARVTVMSENNLPSTVYMNNFAYYKSSGAVTVISGSFDYGFDTRNSMLDTTQLSQSTFVLTSYDQEYTDGGFGKSLKAVISDSGSGYSTGLNLYGMSKNLYNAELDGLRFWIKNPQDYALKFKIMIGDNASINKNYSYYLQRENGKLSEERTSAATDETARGAIDIPANFTGYVYLPYNITAARNYNGGSGHFSISTYPATGNPVTVYFDSFAAYDLADADMVTVFNFDRLTTTGAYITQNGILSNEVTEGGYGKSVKISIASSATSLQTNLFGMATTNAPAYTEAQGYKFWIKNPNDFSIDAFCQFTQSWYNCISGKPYYLISEDGAVIGANLKSKYTNNTGIGCFTIPADFAGTVFIPFSSINSVTAATLSSGSGYYTKFYTLGNGTDFSLYYDSFGFSNVTFSAKLGDVNGDGIVNIKDLVRGKKYLADNNTYINDFGFDIDGLGTFDAVDLASVKELLY